MAFPPEELVDAFEQYAQPLLERVRASIRESRTLAELRDALLPRLLSGALRADAG